MNQEHKLCWFNHLISSQTEVVEVNTAQKSLMVKKIREAMGGVAGKTIGVLGVTFKPETDDIRDAPALTILPALAEKGAKIKIYDPQGMRAAAAILPSFEYTGDAYEASSGADALVLMTEWHELHNLDLRRLKELMRTPLIIDLRNIYEPAVIRAAGFVYIGVGRS